MLFKFINGKKFYCDEKGVVIQKDGVDQEVPATDTTAVDIESGVDETTKMLSEALQRALAAGDQAAVAQIEKTTEAVTRMLESIEEKAKGKTNTVTLTEQKASFDVDAVTKGLKDVATKSGSTVQFEINTKADLEYLAKSTGKTQLTGDVILPDLDPEITRNPVRDVFIEQIADTAETTLDNVSWVEVVTETGAPASTAELATMPEKDFTFQEFKKPVQKCAFRRIRPVVPTRSGQSFRGIRPPEDRCRIGMVFDVRLFGPRQRFRRYCPPFASNGRPVRGDERCEPDGRGSRRQRWVHQSRHAMLLQAVGW